MNLHFEADTNVSPQDQGFLADSTYLNHRVHGLEMEAIPLRSNITPDLIKVLQFKLEWTVPVLNQAFPKYPCLYWCGAKDKDGYAKHKPPRKHKGSTILSRYMYDKCYGVTSKTHVDHICSNRACINPRHLRMLSPELNQLCGDHSKLNTEEGN